MGVLTMRALLLGSVLGHLILKTPLYGFASICIIPTVGLKVRK